MKTNSKKLKSLKKTEKLLTEKNFNVKNVENTKSTEVKINFMDLMTEDMWDYMNDYNNEELKCSLD